MQDNKYLYKEVNGYRIQNIKVLYDCYLSKEEFFNWDTWFSKQPNATKNTTRNKKSQQDGAKTTAINLR